MSSRARRAPLRPRGPDLLPTAVLQVLEAVGESALPGNAKRVYRLIFNLGVGIDGCWLGPAGIGERLGLAGKTVEMHLRELERLGLVERHGRGRRCVFPADCMPHV